MNAPPAAPRILIADDAFDSRQLLARLLRQCTHADIVEVRDGRSAAEQFSMQRPRITFLDIDMPELTGMQVLEQIRADDPNAFVVIVTGFGALENVQEAIARGVSGFVVKPYSPRRIVDVLQKYAAESGDALLLKRAA